jgi:hypothetical protein
LSGDNEPAATKAPTEASPSVAPCTLGHVVRNWLRGASRSKVLPGGAEIYRHYQLFSEELPAVCAELRLQREELTFNDSAAIISDWLRENA